MRSAIIGGNQIRFVKYDPAWFEEKRFVKVSKFLDNRTSIRDRIRVGIKRRRVDDVKEDPRAL